MLFNILLSYTITGSLLLWQHSFPLFFLANLTIPFHREVDGLFSGPASLDNSVYPHPIHWAFWWFLTTIMFPYGTLVLAQIFQRSLFDLDAAWSGLSTASLLYTALATVIQLLYHVPSPTFLTLCQPNQPQMNQIWVAVPEALRTMDVRFDLRICQVKVIKDGPPADYFSRPEALQLKYALMSFPNNTVANSFIAGAFLTIYINARLKPFSRGDKQPNPFKVLLVMFPLMVALGLSSVPLGIHECSVTTACLSALIALPCAYFGYMGCFQSVFDSKTNHMPKIYTLYPWLEQPPVQQPVGAYQNGWYRWRRANRSDRSE